MKLKFFTKTLLSAGIGISLSISTTMNQSSSAQQKTYFCAQRNGEYTTFVKTRRGNIPFLTYSSFGAEWNSRRRCQTISERFQKNHQNGNLKYIRTGQINGYPVLCAVSSSRESCIDYNVLITLQYGTDAQSVLKSIENYRVRSSGKIIRVNADSLYSYDEQGELYLNLDVFVNSVPPDESFEENSESLNSEPLWQW